MELRIQSIHFDADQKLLDFIELKASKLDTFFDKIIGGEVFLRVEKDAKKENKIVEFKLLVPKHEIFVKEQAASFEEATDLAMEVLKNKIKKMKEKLRGE
jgi:putative sigma-54 modulation protein